MTTTNKVNTNSVFQLITTKFFFALSLYCPILCIGREVGSPETLCKTGDTGIVRFQEYVKIYWYRAGKLKVPVFEALN